MQTLAAIGVFFATAAVLQFVGFIVSRAVDSYVPSAGLMTFLVLFIAAYGLAWPIAVRIVEWLIVRMGYQLEQPDPRAQ